MILIVILILLVSLFTGSIESNLMDTFQNPEWIDVNEWERIL